MHGAGAMWSQCNNGYVEPRTYGLKMLRVCFDTAMDTSVIDLSQIISIMGVNGGLQPVAGSVVWESSTCMVITLSSALPDKDAYTLTLKNAIKSSLGVALEETSRCLTAIKGDANANRTVNTQDLLAIRPYLNQPINSSNAKYDINCNGTINTQDMLAARAFLGNIAPTCP